MLLYRNNISLETLYNETVNTPSEHALPACNSRATLPAEIPEIKMNTYLTLSGSSITDKCSNDCIRVAINTYSPLYKHNCSPNIRSAVINFADWPHSSAAMHYSGHVEPRDGAVSVLLSSQQEAIVCVTVVKENLRLAEI
jgi:hypothetical protein